MEAQAHSVDLYRAFLAIQEDRLDDARSLFVQAAEAGDPRGWLGLGVMYSRGQGVVADPTTAAKLYQLAIEGTCMDAAFNLAVLYAQGRGVSQNFKLARKLYKQAALGGDVDARHMVGVMYARGEGGKTSFLDAARWWGQAASQGHGESMTFLGHMYHHADGVAADPLQAALWYVRAIRHQASGAEEHLGLLMEELDIRVHNDRRAQYLMGCIEEVGCFGRSPDLAAAEKFYTQAASMDHPGANRNLGTLYRRIHGEEALRDVANFYIRAAEGGDMEAQHNLGYMHAEGVVLEQNLSKAIFWYQKAALQRFVPSLSDLAIALVRRNQDASDRAEALRCLQEASRLGSGDAMYHLGVLIRQGLWRDLDAVDAARYLFGALNRGVSRAGDVLMEMGDALPLEVFCKAEAQAGGNGSLCASVVLNLQREIH